MVSVANRQAGGLLNITLGVLAAICLLGVALNLWLTPPYGIILSADSIYYLGGGKTLAAGAGLLNPDNSPYTSFPPLMPFISFLAIKLGLAPELVMRAINLLALGGGSFLAGWLLYNLSESSILAILTTSFTVFSYPQQWITQYFLSEPLFVLLSIAAIVSFYAYLMRSSTNQLLLTSIICGALVLQRYTGVLLVGWIVLALVVGKPFKTPVLRARLFRSTLIFVTIPVLAFGLWFAYTLRISGRALGRSRPTTFDQVVSAVERTGSTLLSWLGILGEDRGISFIAFAIFFGLFLAVLLFSLQRIKNQSFRLVFVVIGYTLSLIVVNILSQGTIDPINDRLLLPVFFPVVACVLLPILRLSPKLRIVAAIGLTTLFVVFPFQQRMPSLLTMREVGEGYSSVRWKTSPTIKWLKDHPLDGIIFSDTAPGITHETGQLTFWPPDSGDISWFIEPLKAGNLNIYIVWVNDFKIEPFRKQLDAFVDFRLLYQYENQYVWQIVPK